MYSSTVSTSGVLGGVVLAVFGNCGGSVRDLGICRAKSNGAVCGRWHSACSLVLLIFGQRSAAVKFWLQRWLLSAARFFGVCACARARASLSLKASLLLGTLLCPGARELRDAKVRIEFVSARCATIPQKYSSRREVGREAFGWLCAETLQESRF